MLRNTFLAMSVCVILLAGCGDAPIEQIQGAEDALGRAKVSEAEVYAPDAYKMAADTLRVAMAAKEEADSKFKLLRNYGKAERLVVRAEELANQAATAARQERERMRLELSDLLVSARATVDSAQVALAKAPQGKGSKADIELMKSDLAAANMALSEAAADFEADKYAPAKAKVEAAVNKARGVYGQIAAAAKRMKK